MAKNDHNVRKDEQGRLGRPCPGLSVRIRLGQDPFGLGQRPVFSEPSLDCFQNDGHNQAKAGFFDFGIGTLVAAESPGGIAQRVFKADKLFGVAGDEVEVSLTSQALGQVLDQTASFGRFVDLRKRQVEARATLLGGVDVEAQVREGGGC